MRTQARGHTYQQHVSVRYILRHSHKGAWDLSSTADQSLLASQLPQKLRCGIPQKRGGPEGMRAHPQEKGSLC